MAFEPVFEETDRRDAAAVASLLRTLADDIEQDTAFDFLAGTDADVGVPTEMAVELEVDRDTEADETELEVELVWSGADERDDPVEVTSSETDGADADASGGPTADAEDEAAPDAGSGAASQATFEVYRDRADEWRWRLRHRNGNVIADSGEGYTRRRNAENGLQSVARNAPGADVEVRD